MDAVTLDEPTNEDRAIELRRLLAKVEGMESQRERADAIRTEIERLEA